MTDSLRAASRFHTLVTRRVIGVLAALALAGGIAAGPVFDDKALAASGPSSSLRAPAPAADFVASLDPTQRAALFGGAPHVPATGLRLGDLEPAQRAAAFELVRSLLSADAWEHVSDLIAADAELDAVAGGGSAWSADDYHVALFGDPASDYVLQFATADVVLSALRQGGVVDIRPDVVA